MINVWDTVSAVIHPPPPPSRCFHLRTIFSEKRDWTIYHGPPSDLHTKLGIISMSVPDVVTNSPYIFWDRRWTKCLLYDGPPLGLIFKWWLMCKFGTVESDFLLISCLYSCFYTLPKLCPFFLPLKWFYSEVPCAIISHGASLYSF